MGLYRVNVFFQQRGDRTGGWTTNFWNNADDDATVRSRINKLAGKLNALAGKGCVVTKARYAVSPGFRIADEILYTYSDALGSDPAKMADYQTSAVGVQLTGVGKYKVAIWLSGQDDQAIQRAGRLDGSFKTDPLWADVVTLLKSGTEGWILNVLNKARPKKDITRVTAPNTFTCPAHGFDGSHRIRISRIKGVGRPTGLWKITNITTNTFDLVGYTIADPATLTIKNAIAREELFLTVAIADVIAKRATSHKRGRPTDLLGGRPKTRAS